jgi:hypothetical protein
VQFMRKARGEGARGFALWGSCPDCANPAYARGVKRLPMGRQPERALRRVMVGSEFDIGNELDLPLR